MKVSWTEPAYDVLARLVEARTGLSFSPDRRPSVEIGIRRAMERAGVSGPGRYHELVVRDETMLADLVNELTIGETYFFREPAQFAYVRRVILPEILGRRDPDHSLRVWSAGCASGEEPYSLAMLLEEEGLGGRSHVLATDISTAALAKARRASYGAWSLRGEAAEGARPYLCPGGDRHVVVDSIRRRVTFAPWNLSSDAYPSLLSGIWGMDLIFCRNVLIYFDPETIRAVAGRFFATLADGGWLVTSSCDPPLAGEAPFETVTTEQGVFYRRPRSPEWRASSPVAASSGAGPALGARIAPKAAGLAPTPPRATALPAGPSAPGMRVDVDGAGAGKGSEALIEEARADLARGEYARVVERLREALDRPDACALNVRALANLDLLGAERASTEAVARHSLCADLHFLRAVVLAGLDRDEEAARAVRRAIYLDRSLAVAHFLLGSILRRLGDREGARRAYRNARDLCLARPADEIVALGEGEPAGRLAESARVQLQGLDAAGEAPR